MLKYIATLLLTLTTRPVLAVKAPLIDTSKSPHVKMRNVNLDAVRWTNGFWAERFKLCRKATIPSIQEALLDPANSEHLIGFEIEAGLVSANRTSKDWSDGDCYKWLEAIALVYEVTSEPELDALMDKWIAIIAKAQQPDGYLATQVGSDPSKRFQMPHRHELYSMGHLLTAACVHHRITGKDNFLKVAVKTADMLYRTFKPRPPKLVHFPWNPSVYMGLIEMYRTTGESRYLELGEIMIGNRGSSPGGGDHRNGGTDQTQDRMPFREETYAIGHAVTATYLYAGAADLYAETGEKAVFDALERIWTNVTSRKMFVTGGVGVGYGTSPRGDDLHEAFLDNYELPPRIAYSETCSNVGNAMWNLRMLAITGEAKYGDIVERVLYNSMLSALSADGKNFFYCNPLKWGGEEGGPTKHHTPERWHIHHCYCCPPQIARTIAGLGNWVYSISDDAVWVHLYGSNKLKTELPDKTKIHLWQQTDYPWDGRIKITVEKDIGRKVALKLRIPEWTEGAKLTLNGKSLRKPKPGDYATIKRKWSASDTVELELPMDVRLIEAHPNVKPLADHVTVMRGPVVYCLELPKRDQGEQIWNEGVFLNRNAEFQTEFQNDLFGGVTVLNTRALTTEGKKSFVAENAKVKKPKEKKWSNKLYRPLKPRKLAPPTQGTVDIELIPYFAWANRGVSFMEVWIPLAR
ncbi:MAG: glycoside hydrolase family 127 protein [Planctomycetota bacterium]|jgi:DUF1680 family protein